jgi:hypothetical protein
MTSPDVLFLFDGDNTLSGSIRPGVTSWGKANCAFRQPKALAKGRSARRTCSPWRSYTDLGLGSRRWPVDGAYTKER